MKVLLLFTGGDIGGAERSLTRMAAAAREFGSCIEYQVATLSGRGIWFAWAGSLGLGPVAFGASKKLGWRELFRAVQKALGYAKEHGVKVIYVMGIRAAMCLRWLRGMYPGIRLVHGIRSNPAGETWFEVLFRLSEKTCGRRVDLFISNSLTAAHTLEKRCGIPAEKIRVVYNGVAVSTPDLLPWEERSKHMVILANVQARKGITEIATAFLRLRRTLPDWRCSVLGEIFDAGEAQREYAHKDLLDMVEFAGFQSNVPGYLRDARLLLFPSQRGEGAPTSILEAFAFAVPVVGYAVDGIPELVRDGVEGLLVRRVGNAEDFAAAVEKIASDPELAVAMGEAGRRRVAEEFTMEKCVKGHEAALLSLWDKKRSFVTNGKAGT